MNFKKSAGAEVEEIASGGLTQMSLRQEQIGLQDKMATLEECIELFHAWREETKSPNPGGRQRD